MYGAVVSLVWIGAAPTGSAPKGSAPKKNLKRPASQTFDSELGANIAKKTKGFVFRYVTSLKLTFIIAVQVVRVGGKRAGKKKVQLKSAVAKSVHKVQTPNLHHDKKARKVTSGKFIIYIFKDNST
jgi:hypothetical protein